MFLLFCVFFLIHFRLLPPTPFTIREKTFTILYFFISWPIGCPQPRFCDPYFSFSWVSENPCAVGSAVRCEPGVGSSWPTPFLLLLHRPKSHLLKAPDSCSLLPCGIEVLLPHGCPENCSRSFFRSRCVCIRAEPLNLSPRFVVTYSYRNLEDPSYILHYLPCFLWT